MNIQEIISSGIIDEYILGALSPNDAERVQRLAEEHPAIQKEIECAEKALESYMQSMAVSPPDGLRDRILGTIQGLNTKFDLSSPPVLDRYSDAEQWRKAFANIQPPDDFEDIHLHMIVEDDTRMLAKAWVKDAVPDETHSDEIERFLILEGTCTCTIGQDVYHLEPGDFIEIPPHVNHDVKITSTQPVVAMVQRIAA